MKKLFFGAALLGGFVLSSGCMTRANGPIFAPIQASKGAVSMGDSAVRGTKIGKSEAMGVLIVGVGDSSIGAAAMAGQITKIHHVDSEQFNILGIYSRNITIVYGE
jgi:hypothetical protein